MLDANFRLKNHLQHRNKNKKDKPLYSGLGYQVPTEEYLEHLKNYVNENDVGFPRFASLVLTLTGAFRSVLV